MRIPEDFDAYGLVATVNGDVELVCTYCPDSPWRFEPNPSNLLEVAQTVRTHNGRCLERAILAAKATLRANGNRTPTAGEVGPLIPEALRRAFWKRYTDIYFDGSLIQWGGRGVTPDAYVYRGHSYPVRLQFRYMPTVAVGFPTCPKRNPCAGCARKARRAGQ